MCEVTTSIGAVDDAPDTLCRDACKKQFYLNFFCCKYIGIISMGPTFYYDYYDLVTDVM